jgi:uncharacterized protein YjbI with pentapeptide repeats
MLDNKRFQFIQKFNSLGEISYVPYLNFSLLGQRDSVLVSGLLDTGASVNVLPYESANLSSARLDHANLNGTNLSSADLCQTSLIYANLDNANLDSAILRGAIVEKASFKNVLGLSETDRTTLQRRGARFKPAIFINDRNNVISA